jgi:hypothetical protein
MLYAKINPPASRVDQSNPFGSPRTVISNYMTAMARPYALGGRRTRFEIQYGNVTLNADGYATGFSQEMNGEIILTSEQLANWGSDDSVVLQIIAASVGTSIESYVTSPPPVIVNDEGATAS